VWLRDFEGVTHPAGHGARRGNDGVDLGRQRGIGASIARALHGAGRGVVLSGRRAEALSEQIIERPRTWRA
jgi:hypothetical protein